MPKKKQKRNGLGIRVLQHMEDKLEEERIEALANMFMHMVKGLGRDIDPKVGDCIGEKIQQEVLNHTKYNASGGSYVEKREFLADIFGIKLDE